MKENNRKRRTEKAVKVDQQSNNPKKEQENGLATLTSMIGSVILVALAWAFIIGFHYFLQGQTYQAPSHEEKTEATEEQPVVDESFSCPYIIIKNISEKEPLYMTTEPGVIDENSVILQNGQMLATKQKFSFHQKNFYELKDGKYVEVVEKRVQEVAEYLPLNGYINITYISSSGVRIRSWVDFDADNVVSSVYVGDNVKIGGLVTLVDGTTAFRITEEGLEGLYITTDTQYFTDFTNLSSKSTEDLSAPVTVTNTGDQNTNETGAATTE